MPIFLSKPTATVNSSDLVVPFPSKTRRRKRTQIFSLAADPDQANTTKKSNPRSVHFAEYSTLYMFRRASASENDRKWYSRRDMERFRETYEADISEIRGKVSPNAKDACIHHDDFLCSVGLNGNASLRISRRNHQRVVLEEANRQRSLNIMDDERLRRVSVAFSVHGKNWAKELATVYWNIDWMGVGNGGQLSVGFWRMPQLWRIPCLPERRRMMTSKFQTPFVSIVQSNFCRNIVK